LAQASALKEREIDRAMKLLRAVAAILVFLAGLITLAGALYSVAITAATAAATHQPISLSNLTGGLIACAIGILCLFISRAIDSEQGPVRRYGDRRRKSRVHV
jgi:hypothetical protein